MGSTEIREILIQADVMDEVIVDELYSALCNVRREMRLYEEEKKGHPSDYSYNMALETGLTRVINHYSVSSNINEYVRTE